MEKISEEKKRLKLQLFEIELKEFLILFEVFYNFKKMISDTIYINVDSEEISKYFKMSFEEFKNMINKSNYKVLASIPQINEFDGHDGHVHQINGYISIGLKN